MNQERTIIGYDVVHGANNSLVKRYPADKRRLAYALAEKRNQAHGSYLYTVQLVWS